MGRVRLKDVAKEAGVAVITVSKALRGCPDVAPATRARIALIAQKLGYIPDASARGLRCKRTGMIGVLISKVTNPFVAAFVDGVVEKLGLAGFDILLAQSENDPEREDHALTQFLSRRVEGLIIMPCPRPAVEVLTYKRLRVTGVPAVIVGPPAVFYQGLPCVWIDEKGGARQLTRHLVELKHRRIAYVAGPSLSASTRLKLDGYKQALRECELEVEDELIQSVGSGLEDGLKVAQAMGELFAAGVTAVEIANDLVALGLVTGLVEMGIKIPEQVSVTGFGDMWFSRYAPVPLTTVHVPKYSLGVKAADTLLALLSGENVKDIIMPVELVIRASTGPCPIPAARKTD